jgi:hypothetical protein
MDPRTILKTLKEASPFDLFLISFLLLPFVFDAWLGVADRLQWGGSARNWTLALVLAFYVVGVVAMLQGSSRAQRREAARDQIIQYLTSKDFEMMSYERVRQNINRTYGDDFLDSLITHFPNDLRKARLKGGKPGVARLIESPGENEV